METQSDGLTPPRHPVRIPKPRYQCASDYCPKPGYVHRGEYLFLDTNVNRPGFFCPTCRPKPMLTNLDEPPTLTEYLNNPPETG